ncbi:Ubiquitin-conjugating enzyme E2 14 [Ceratocystis lukuohia]|uniref:E2 ubiquitin-conjugating enzyme n=3 Tax=Ceratocystis TaxID=5157 RepID=A0A0F8D9V3_CERFI|nr:Ubiquitin-conjugating enzyme E2 14 [Ceratocystis platani]PHH51876.1 Ubiquitin-conjugating enzyme E2 14 [Ceratocystis fimbriata CBS 114723]
MASTKRINKELADITANPIPGISVSLLNDVLHTWACTISGPENTPYVGGAFTIHIMLPTDYPFKPPAVKFVTRIYHPNVTNDEQGSVCLGLLKSENWKPNTRVASVLEAIRALMIEPNADDPLDTAIANQYQTDRAAFNREAASMTKAHAS